jgi:hypothetical protein
MLILIENRRETNPGLLKGFQSDRHLGFAWQGPVGNV